MSTNNLQGEIAALTFDHGRNADVDATAEQLSTVDEPCVRGVTVKAAAGNAGMVYVGNSDVTGDSAGATDGYELDAGESVFIAIDNVNKVWVRGSVVDQIVYWISV